VDSPKPGPNERAHRDIVVIGASAGGVEDIMAVLRQLPGNLKASIFVVCHMLPTAKSHLVDALNTSGPFVAKFGDDEEAIAHGIVYVAPPDRHLLVKPGHVRITRGPRENRWRPAIDPLFRSAAVAYGERVIGVVLTGMLDDGTAGLLAIKRCHGVAIVQDPEEAVFPDMPRTALANVHVDHRLLTSDMGPVIERLVAQSVSRSGTVPADIQTEARIAESGYSDEHITDKLGELTPLSCPECSGPLWQHASGQLDHYRCRVGHAYSANSLLSAADEAIEASIWAAVRLFDQRANVLTAMADRDRQAQRFRMVQHHEQLAKEARNHAKILRQLLVKEMSETAQVA
jgi:two-component system chemotaxis response regulator CheB